MEEINKHFDEIYRHINDIEISKLKKLKIIFNLEEMREKIENKKKKREQEKISLEFLYT